MGLLTFAIQKKCQIPWKEKWSCFATHISCKVCGLTQTLVAASKESHQSLSLRKGRKEITKRRQEEERMISQDNGFSGSMCTQRSSHHKDRLD